MNIKCSALIHARTRHVDYRTEFLARPKDIDILDIREIKKYVLQTTSSTEELAGVNKLRKMMLSYGDYIIFGITAYVKGIYSLCNSSIDEDLFKDDNNRDSYAFVGIVAKRSDIKGTIGFPDISAFKDILDSFLVPRLDEQKYMEKSRQATLLEFDMNMGFPDAKTEGYPNTVNFSREDKVKVFPWNQSEVMISEALLAAMQGKKISACTNLGFRDDAAKSFYMNASVQDNDQMYIVDNGKKISDMQGFAATRPDYASQYNGNSASSANDFKENRKNAPVKYKKIDISFQIPDNFQSENVIREVAAFLSQKGFTIISASEDYKKPVDFFGRFRDLGPNHKDK